MSQKRSPLWLYFEVSVTNIRIAICKICGKKESRGSSIPKNMTTNRLKKHLEKEHPKENAIVEKKQKAKNNNVSSMFHGSNESSSMSEGNNPGFSMNNGSGGSSSLTNLRTKADRKEHFQQTIPEWKESQTKLAFNSQKAQKFHKSIFELIILDDQPFEIVNNRGFLRHHQRLVPNFEVCYHINLSFKFHIMEDLFVFQIASDKYYRSLLEPIFNKVKGILMGIVSKDNPNSVSFALDAWSAMRHSFLGIVAYYLKDWKRVVFHVYCQPFDESHTAENIRGSMEEHLRE